MTKSVSSVPLRFLSGFGLLIAAVVATGWFLFQQQRSAAWVEHTLVAQGQLGSLFTALQDAEVAQRSFLLTSEQQYLARFNDDLTSIGPQLDQLTALVADNAEQVTALSYLRVLMETRRDLLAETVQLAQAGDGANAIRRFREGRERAKLVDIRAAVAGMTDGESLLLRKRQATSKVAGLAGWLGVAGERRANIAACRFVDPGSAAAYQATCGGS